MRSFGRPALLMTLCNLEAAEHGASQAEWNPEPSAKREKKAECYERDAGQGSVRRDEWHGSDVTPQLTFLLPPCILGTESRGQFGLI